MAFDEIRDCFDKIKKTIEAHGIRLDALEASDAEKGDFMKSIQSQIQETNSIVKSMTTNLGNDPNTGMPNTLCGLFSKVNSALDRYEERDRRQVEEIVNLKNAVDTLTKAVDRKTWIRNISGDAAKKIIGLLIGLTSAIVIAIAEPWTERIVQPEDSSSKSIGTETEKHRQSEPNRISNPQE